VTLILPQLYMPSRPVPGWDLANASYDSVSFLTSDAGPFGMAFKDDGTKMYIIEFGSDAVYQYSLSTAWDVSTASYDSVSFSVGSQASSPTCLAFKGDGTKMYIAGITTDRVHQYSLSTAWDLSTASYDSVSFFVRSEESIPYDLAFKGDGTKMYIVGFGSGAVHQYSLSTAWDLANASYDSVSFSVGSQESSPTCLAFKDDGTKMYVMGSGSDTVYQYSLPTAWDVSTASYDSVSFSVRSQEAIPNSFEFKGDGTKMYVMGSASHTVYQYSLP